MDQSAAGRHTEGPLADPLKIGKSRFDEIVIQLFLVARQMKNSAKL